MGIVRSIGITTLLILIVPIGGTPAQEVPVVENGLRGSMRRGPVLEELAVIGQEGPEESLLFRPRGILFAPDGRVLIPDAGNHAILVYDDYGLGPYPGPSCGSTSCTFPSLLSLTLTRATHGAKAESDAYQGDNSAPFDRYRLPYYGLGAQHLLDFPKGRLDQVLYYFHGSPL